MAYSEDVRIRMMAYPPDYCRQHLMTTSGSMTPVQRHKINRALQRFAQVFPRGLSEYEKVLLLYEVITRTVQYDESDAKDPLSYTAVGPLLRQTGVCIGIAELFTLVCSCLGIRCLTVIGYATCYTEQGGHAWNMVQLPAHGERPFYHLDPTWDLGVRRSQWNYFLLTDNEILCRDHAWLKERYPSCSTPAPHGWRIQELNHQGVKMLCQFFKQGLLYASLRSS